MDRSYAAELNEHNEVIRIIVGSAEWASDNLGGIWTDSDEKVGAGWILFSDGLRPPQPFNSWSWVNDEWVPPVPMPEAGQWLWDENRLSWLEII